MNFKKANYMKRALVLILWLLPFISMAQKTVFSGKWDLNLQNTDFQQAPDWLFPKSIEIKQKNDLIIIEAKIYDNQRLQHYYTETISFDGTTSETITYDNNKRMASLKWKEDNKSFVLSVRPVTAEDQSGPDFTETWSLENDGKTLVVNRMATQANDYNIKAYYDKK
jgi:hypothetical protein